MRSESLCNQIRVDLSARMDGEVDSVRSRELDEHLAGCADCRSYETSIRRVKRAVRLQPAMEVPDLTPRILEAIGREPRILPRREVWRTRARIALVAATVGALVMAGTSLRFGDRPVDSAVADDIPQQIRAAARELTGYHAEYAIEESGWHPQVPSRSFTAEIWFEAPESLRLEVRDRTEYPGPDWPPNNVALIADGSSWWIKEASSCPTEALPGCAVRPTVEERSLVHRQPFDGTSSLPTDIILPLESVASTEGLEVVGREEVAGRPAYHVTLEYWQAVPLVAALQAGGSWRNFDPHDRVDLWLDETTWFPLRFMVARHQGDAPLLDVIATSFDRPDAFDAELFDAPSSGIVRDGGFETDGSRAGPVPSPVAGLLYYRSGVTSDGQRVTTYSRGMSWLKVAVDRPRRPSFTAASAEIVHVGSGYALYQPGTEFLRRRVDIFGRSAHVHLESNLSRDQLLNVASTFDIRGRRFDRVREGRGVIVSRIGFSEAAELRFALTPTYLPEGYRPSAALVSRSGRGSRLTTFYRRAEAEFEGSGIRITEAPGFESLPPSSEELTAVTIDDLRARWSAERSELEWVQDGVYRSVSVPAFDLDTAARVAASLR